MEQQIFEGRAIPLKIYCAQEEGDNNLLILKEYAVFVSGILIIIEM